MDEVDVMTRKMKIILVCLCFFVLIIKAQGEIQWQNKSLNHDYAKILHASYQTDHFVIELEINHKVYAGQFIYPLEYDEYLFLHHNEGSIIGIYYLPKNDWQILIYEWYPSK